MQKKYCTIYYITLNSNCEAQRASKNLKKKLENGVRSQMSDLTVNFSLFKGEKYVKKSLNKIIPQSPKEKLSRYLWNTSFCT